MRWYQIARGALLAVLLTSCGGGGGGGGSDGGGGGSVRFTPNRTTIAFDFMEGGARPEAQEVIVTATGNLPNTLYIGAVAEGQGIDPAITILISGTTGTFQILPNMALPEGTYTGRVQLLGCSDAACSNQIGNSPVTVNYTTRVHPRLRVAPTAINLSAESGSSATADIAVTLPWQSTTHEARVVFGADQWLSVSSPNATTARVTARSMPSGVREGQITVNAGTQTVTIPVTYTVTPPPGGEFDLRTDPVSLTFAATEATAPPSQTIRVLGPTWSPDLPTQTWTTYTWIGREENWLTVTTTTDGYEIAASAANLSAGTYTAVIRVESTDLTTPSTAFTVPVSFTVGGGLIRPADVDVTIDANTDVTSAALRGSAAIELVEGPAVAWSATSDRNWLSITTPNGTTGDTLEYVINPDELDFYYPYDADDTATITVASAYPLNPVSFEVRMHKRLAYIEQIMPSFRIAGRASRHIIRGRNFIADRDWSQYLEIMGAPAGARVTRVNDTTLVVRLEGAFAGGVFDPINGLPVSGSRVIPTLPYVTHDYAAIPTGFEVARVLYDQERGRLHVVDENDGLGRLLTHTRELGTWQQWPAVLVPGLRDAMFEIDRRFIRTTGTDGMRVFDANSMQYPSAAFEPEGGLVLSGNGGTLGMINDGSLWFTQDSGAVAYLDYPLGNTVPNASGLLDPTARPWFASSGDGERLYISQSTSPTASSPLLWLNASDGALQVVPNQSEDGYLVEPSMSDDASRLVAGGFRVRDAEFNLIGHVNVTQHNFTAVTANVSADGRRAYVLAYEQGEFTAPTPLTTPRVYVFDLTNPVSPDQQMPLLGYFPLADYPTCLRAADCNIRPSSTLSADGGTLFYGGRENLIVAPIPAEGTLLARRGPVFSKRSVVTKRMK